MVYPTARAILLAAAGVPLALALGAFAPGWWLAGLAWAVAAMALTLADALMGPGARAASLSVESSGTLQMGREARIAARTRFRRAAPRQVEMALGTNDRVAVSPGRAWAPVREREAVAPLSLHPRRRGQAVLETLWARWRGPMGLAWIQAVQPLDR